MARLIRAHVPGFECMPECGTTISDAHNEILDAYLEVSDSLSHDEIVGAVICFPGFPVCEGHAYYLVVNDDPVLLSHIPYGPSWHANIELINKVDREFILDRRRKSREVLHLLHGRARRTS